ncbi:hypothetical protein IW261DRAFT_1446593 [Armillaria novae-zelandiae]|uniref:Uncharacterized protein n=1 Tax=Armillaria novae-zelandiae TaxID=153914 RepID=A0AA39UPH1_9AGAR|nr:hypothetical protein IW261DRAFT_1446593 [Armillaria novae-zelandiae]
MEPHNQPMSSAISSSLMLLLQVIVLVVTRSHPLSPTMVAMVAYYLYCISLSKRVILSRFIRQERLQTCLMFRLHHHHPHFLAPPVLTRRLSLYGKTNLKFVPMPFFFA